MGAELAQEALGLVFVQTISADPARSPLRSGQRGGGGRLREDRFIGRLGLLRLSARGRRSWPLVGGRSGIVVGVRRKRGSGAGNGDRGIILEDHGQVMLQ